MTTLNPTIPLSQSIIVQPIEVTYNVTDKRGKHRVTVSMSGAYECKCHSFTLYGGCDHVEAVQAERKAQGESSRRTKFARDGRLFCLMNGRPLFFLRRDTHEQNYHHIRGNRVNDYRQRATRRQTPRQRLSCWTGEG